MVTLHQCAQVYLYQLYDQSIESCFSHVFLRTTDYWEKRIYSLYWFLIMPIYSVVFLYSELCIQGLETLDSAYSYQFLCWTWRLLYEQWSLLCMLSEFWRPHNRLASQKLSDVFYNVWDHLVWNFAFNQN